MAEENKSSSNGSASKTTESKSPAATPASATAGQNGKGDSPRNCFSETFRSNFDAIDWSK